MIVTVISMQSSMKKEDPERGRKHSAVLHVYFITLDEMKKKTPRGDEN